MLGIGIDNGADGAISGVRLDVGLVHVGGIVAPTIDVQVKRRRKGKQYTGTKRVADYAGMLRAVRKLKGAARRGEYVFAVIEQVGTRPGESPMAALQYGAGFGAWCMALVACDIPYVVERARTWQLDVLAGVEGSDTKARSLLASRRLCPSSAAVVDALTRKAQRHGMSDATCMGIRALRLARANGHEDRA